MSQPTVLITGGLGFIGSYLAEAYLRDGWAVQIVDDRRCPVVERVEGAEVWETDAAHLPPLDDADLVVHAASPVGPAAIARSTDSIAWEIVRTARAVTEACRRADTPLVLISTSEVYGVSGECVEGMTCQLPDHQHPRLEYGLGKLVAERLAHRCRSVIIRPFNVAGARQDARKGFVVPTFIEQALAGKPLTIFGRGDQRRAFMGVEDLVRFIVTISSRPSRFTGETFNVGAPRNEATVLELAQLVAREVGRFPPNSSAYTFTSGEAVHGSGWAEAAGYHKVPNTEKAEAEGWSPRLRLPELVRAVAAEIERSHQAPSAVP